MQIDNYTEATALSNKLEAAVPFKVYPGKEFLKLLQEKGKRVSPEDELEVTWVKYSGDMGGIMCGLKAEGDKEVFVTSLTYLKFDPTHPLAEEVKAYQQKRIRGLKLQESKSVMAELIRMQQSTKKKPGKGGLGK